MYNKSNVNGDCGTIEIVTLAQFTLGLKARAEVGYSRGHIIKVQVTLRHSRR